MAAADRSPGAREPGPAGNPGPLPDILGPDLAVLFCGINPGLRSASAGHHYANPRNDFWRLLADVGLTPRRLDPSEQHAVLDHRIGLTNSAPRATPGSADLRRADFAGAASRLEAIAQALQPEIIAFVGKAAYEGAFRERPALGLQRRVLGGSRLFVLPSTSPANASVPYAERLRWFGALAELAGAPRTAARPSAG